MFKLKKNKPVKTGIHTPKFRNPTPPPPLKPPTSGSNAQKPYAALFEREPKTSPGIILPNDICTITIICPYETPCGWCAKWDKKCDKKIGGGESNDKPTRGLREEGNVYDDNCSVPKGFIRKIIQEAVDFEKVMNQLKETTKEN